MKSIIALEDMIKENESVIKSIKKQLANHASGESKLSYMGLASAETNLENALAKVAKQKERLKELMSLDHAELLEKEKIKDAIERQNYLDFQTIRIKRDVTASNDLKLEAMSILDEVGQECMIEDSELFEIAETSLSLNLTQHVDLDKKYREIKNAFETFLKKIDDENIKDLGILNFRAILTILQMNVLYTNIQEVITEKELRPFPGFPKFEDWWIKELWRNHNAYYALFKWKDIIENLCNTSEQKRTWKRIFTNWLSLKRILSQKGVLGYHYNYMFDTIMREHTSLEEELATKSLKSMDALTKKLIAKVDFSIESPKHNIITDYVIFKREQLDYKDVK
jgi:hypothetical protein